MLKKRIIPCLLLKDMGLVKTTKFKNPTYIGDPINAVKIFNEKEVDEIIFLDIEASKQNRSPDFEMIEKIASECFMPFCYGGGLTSLEDMKTVFSIGAEKVALNSTIFKNDNLIREAAEYFGNQSIVASIDIKKNLFSQYRVYRHTTKKTTEHDPVDFAKKVETLGAGELFLNNVDKDGTMKGLDVHLINKIASSVNIPVIACGGAGSLEHIKEVICAADVDAVAAGSLFVFKGRHRAVLINYPTYTEIEQLLQNEPEIKS